MRSPLPLALLPRVTKGLNRRRCRAKPSRYRRLGGDAWAGSAAAWGLARGAGGLDVELWWWGMLGAAAVVLSVQSGVGGSSGRLFVSDAGRPSPVVRLLVVVRHGGVPWWGLSGSGMLR